MYACARAYVCAFHVLYFDLHHTHTIYQTNECDVMASLNISNIFSLNGSEIYGMLVIFNKWMFMGICKHTPSHTHTHAHNITHAYIDLGKSTDTIHKRIIRHQWLSPIFSLTQIVSISNAWGMVYSIIFFSKRIIKYF